MYDYEPNDCLNERQVQAYLGVALSTLHSWRSNGKGPRWHKVGVRAVYIFAEVQEYARERGQKCD